MRFTLGILATLAAGIGLAVLLVKDPGYVLIHVGSYTLEMSFTALILLLIAIFAGLWFSIKVFILAVNTPKRINASYAQKRLARSQLALTRGIIEVAEGRWEQGERFLGKYAGDSQTPLVNFLAAARAAQLQGAHERRDKYLRAAYEETPKATIAVLLTQAELQMAHNQFEHALATLRRVQELKPGHNLGLQLLSKLYESMKDWESLEKLIPQLKKNGVLNDAEVERIEIHSIKERCDTLAKTGGEEALKTFWQSLPRKKRQRADVIKHYARALSEAGANDTAETVIRSSLKTGWDDELMLLYGTLKTSNPEQQLARVESWLKEHGDNAVLLLTAGRLCVTAGLWGKARNYLQASIDSGAMKETYQELGLLLQSLGEPENAMLAFKEGLLLTQETDRMASSMNTPLLVRQPT
ncbi:MAG: hypothetical protein MJA83_09785 [Gammaproteobacteria bacterium]|nr:hypothetical protein [Gammaproteobacteria bacterium]